MRVIIQRCLRATVYSEGDCLGSISKGLMLLVGITHTDTTADADYIAKKIAAMRIFEDEQGKMNLSIKEVDGAILSISQFTLYADTRRGNRPSFIDAAPPDMAKSLYDYFNDQLVNAYSLVVETGRFGADMHVDFINDGPVTIIIDSKNP